MTDNHAYTQAKAQAESIAEMVAALECDYDRLEELRDARYDFDGTDDEWAVAHLQNAEELAELETAAGDCESREGAEQRILDNALEVKVRSGWVTPGQGEETGTYDEFQILLCTGGPAVRIMGELTNNQPSRAWIEYQDWGTPWTHAPSIIEQDTLLTYCQQFYFGD